MAIQVKKDWWKASFKEAYLRTFVSYLPQQTKKEIDFIIHKLSLKKTDKILDIPCGQGRHSIELANRGFCVTGVDYSPVLLSAAKKDAEENKVSPIFIKKDIRSIKLRQKFDSIIVLGNSFGYFDDLANERVVMNLNSLLKKKGYLVLDLSNSIGMIRTLKETEHAVKIIKKGKNILRIQESYVFDPTHLVKTIQWRMSEGGKRWVISAKLRLYTFPEIKNLLARHNFYVKEIHGSFSGGKYTIESPRMIIIAQKRS